MYNILPPPITHSTNIIKATTDTSQEYIPSTEELQQIVHSFVGFFVFFSLLAILILIVLTIILIQFSKSWHSKKESAEYLMHVIQAQEEERSHLSSELHDSLAQNLRVAMTLMEDDKIRSILKECISSVRSICYNLAPPDLTTAKLSDAIKSLCLKFQNENKIEVSLAIRQDAEPLVDSENLTLLQRTSLYRIVQELFTNVQKHAKAGEVSVIIRRESEEEQEGLYMSVADDGVGFDLQEKRDADSSGGFGLKGIRQRGMQLDGRIDISSESGCGTEVTLFVPIKAFTRKDI